MTATLRALDPETPCKRQHAMNPATLDVLLAVDHAASRSRPARIDDTPSLVAAIQSGLVLVHGPARYSLTSEGGAQLRRASFRIV